MLNHLIFTNMITYNNDVLSEIWDAKRLIREYVNVAHLVSNQQITVVKQVNLSPYRMINIKNVRRITFFIGKRSNFATNS